MTWLAPGWLVAAAIAAGAVMLAHFFARRRPRSLPLPTARFVPDVSARAPSLSPRPADLLLLLVRLLAVAAIGVALARPVPAPERRAVARILAIDTADGQTGGRADGQADTTVGAPGVSAALVAAIRASAAYHDRADSIELVLSSTFTTLDDATDSIRRLWPGRVRLIVRPVAEQKAPRITLVGAADDPLRATIALMTRGTGAEARILRAQPSAADSAFARAGGVLVSWPAGSGDTAAAVRSEHAVVVAPLVRTHAPAGRAIATWVDGTPAASERTLGAGCVRDVAIGIPAAGDLVLRPSLGELVRDLTAPCGGWRAAVADSARLASLRGDGPLMTARLAPSLPRRPHLASAWLLALAALLLIGEQVLRPKAQA